MNILETFQLSQRDDMLKKSCSMIEFHGIRFGKRDGTYGKTKFSRKSAVAVHRCDFRRYQSIAGLKRMRNFNSNDLLDNYFLTTATSICLTGMAVMNRVDER